MDVSASGPKSVPVVDGMSNPQGGRSMHASEILFVGSGFRLFFNLTEAKAAFHRATATPQGRAAQGHGCKAFELSNQYMAEMPHSRHRRKSPI